MTEWHWETEIASLKEELASYAVRLEQAQEEIARLKAEAATLRGLLREARYFIPEGDGIELEERIATALKEGR